jgi:ribonuclease BN (tRNA processing enzyme)
VNIVKLRVLGCSGAEFPGHNPPAFLIDGKLLLDGGTIGARLSEPEQWNIKNILITHSHLDHIKGIPFLADNIVIKNRRHSITLFGIKETLAALRENLLNDKLWPDFTKISAAIDPVIKLRNVTVNRAFRLGDYTIKASRVDHTVPAVGYTVKDRNGRVLLYTGDTGPTDKIWHAAPRVDAVIVEVSFPNKMEALAIKTGHLTSRLLAKELDKMKNFHGRVYVTHPKPQYIGLIKKEIRRIDRPRIEMLKDGKVYEI